MASGGWARAHMSERVHYPPPLLLPPFPSGPRPALRNSAAVMEPPSRPPAFL